jgi:phenylpropionate dioxygenase-like ring-hydroxylating dioxygenase large terminal subunit
MADKTLPQLPERIPLPPFPNGWYSVAYADELKVGEVKRIQAFGAELVLFRGEDGVARALDAYCSHLGAHLAVGGKVVGNNIQCPFHAWEYDGTGKCVNIPYSSKIPPRAKQECWPVRELNGYIVVWHHAEKKAPEYEIPEIPELSDPKFRLFKENTWEVHTHLQEVFENAIDIPHFVVVHGMNVLRKARESDSLVRVGPGPLTHARHGLDERRVRADAHAGRTREDRDSPSLLRQRRGRSDQDGRVLRLLRARLGARLRHLEQEEVPPGAEPRRR